MTDKPLSVHACSTVEVAAWRCIKPHCPTNCDGCNHAIKNKPSAKLLVVEMLDMFAVDDLGSPYEQGDSKVVDKARAFVCGPELLPELPPACRAFQTDSTMRVMENDYYTAYDMREYGRACASAGAYKPEELRERALAALEGADAVQGWRPIAEAPQGRKLIVGYPNKLGNWRTVLGRYYPEGTLPRPDDYDEEFAPAGWYEESESQEYIFATEETPTHWMPLPEAPPPAAQPDTPAPDRGTP